MNNISKIKYSEQFSSDDELEKEDDNQLLNYNCLVLEYGMVPKTDRYFICSCTPEQNSLICAECIRYCHLGSIHTVIDTIVTSGICQCGLNSHKIRKDNSSISKIKSECLFNEINRASGCKEIYCLKNSQVYEQYYANSNLSNLQGTSGDINLTNNKDIENSNVNNNSKKDNEEEAFKKYIEDKTDCQFLCPFCYNFCLDDTSAHKTDIIEVNKASSLQNNEILLGKLHININKEKNINQNHQERLGTKLNVIEDEGDVKDYTEKQDHTNTNTNNNKIKIITDYSTKSDHNENIIPTDPNNNKDFKENNIKESGISHKDTQKEVLGLMEDKIEDEISKSLINSKNINIQETFSVSNIAKNSSYANTNNTKLNPSNNNNTIINSIQLSKFPNKMQYNDTQNYLSESVTELYDDVNNTFSKHLFNLKEELFYHDENNNKENYDRREEEDNNNNALLLKNLLNDNYNNNYNENYNIVSNLVAKNAENHSVKDYIENLNHNKASSFKHKFTEYINNKNNYTLLNLEDKEIYNLPKCQCKNPKTHESIKSTLESIQKLTDPSYSWLLPFSKARILNLLSTCTFSNSIFEKLTEYIEFIINISSSSNILKELKVHLRVNDITSIISLMKNFLQIKSEYIVVMKHREINKFGLAALNDSNNNNNTGNHLNNNRRNPSMMKRNFTVNNYDNTPKAFLNNNFIEEQSNIEFSNYYFYNNIGLLSSLYITEIFKLEFFKQVFSIEIENTQSLLKFKIDLLNIFIGLFIDHPLFFLPKLLTNDLVNLPFHYYNILKFNSSVKNFQESMKQKSIEMILIRFLDKISKLNSGLKYIEYFELLALLVLQYSKLSLYSCIENTEKLVSLLIEIVNNLIQFYFTDYKRFSFDVLYSNKLKLIIRDLIYSIIRYIFVYIIINNDERILNEVSIILTNTHNSNQPEFNYFKNIKHSKIENNSKSNSNNDNNNDKNVNNEDNINDDENQNENVEEEVDFGNEEEESEDLNNKSDESNEEEEEDEKEDDMNYAYLDYLDNYFKDMSNILNSNKDTVDNSNGTNKTTFTSHSKNICKLYLSCLKLINLFIDKINNLDELKILVFKVNSLLILPNDLYQKRLTTMVEYLNYNQNNDISKVIIDLENFNISNNLNSNSPAYINLISTINIYSTNSYKSLIIEKLIEESVLKSYNNSNTQNKISNDDILAYNKKKQNNIIIQDKDVKNSFNNNNNNNNHSINHIPNNTSNNKILYKDNENNGSNNNVNNIVNPSNLIENLSHYSQIGQLSPNDNFYFKVLTKLCKEDNNIIKVYLNYCQFKTNYHFTLEQVKDSLVLVLYKILNLNIIQYKELIKISSKSKTSILTSQYINLLNSNNANTASSISFHISKTNDTKLALLQSNYVFSVLKIINISVFNESFTMRKKYFNSEFMQLIMNLLYYFTYNSIENTLFVITNAEVLMTLVKLGCYFNPNFCQIILNYISILVDFLYEKSVYLSSVNYIIEILMLSFDNSLILKGMSNTNTTNANTNTNNANTNANTSFKSTNNMNYFHPSQINVNNYMIIEKEKPNNYLNNNNNTTNNNVNHSFSFLDCKSKDIILLDKFLFIVKKLIKLLSVNNQIDSMNNINSNSKENYSESLNEVSKLNKLSNIEENQNKDSEMELIKLNISKIFTFETVTLIKEGIADNFSFLEDLWVFTANNTVLNYNSNSNNINSIEFGNNNAIVNNANNNPTNKEAIYSTNNNAINATNIRQSKLVSSSYNNIQQPNNLITTVESYFSMFSKLLSIINMVFSGSSIESDVRVFSNFLSEAKIQELLKRNDLSFSVRKELLRFYEMIYIKLFVDKKKLNNYKQIFTFSINGITNKRNSELLNNLVYLSIDKEIYRSAFKMFINELKFAESVIIINNNLNKENETNNNNAVNNNISNIPSLSSQSEMKKFCNYLELGLLKPLVFLFQVFNVISDHFKGTELLDIISLLFYFIHFKKTIYSNEDLLFQIRVIIEDANSKWGSGCETTINNFNNEKYNDSPNNADNSQYLNYYFLYNFIYSDLIEESVKMFKNSPDCRFSMSKMENRKSSLFKQYYSLVKNDNKGSFILNNNRERKISFDNNKNKEINNNSNINKNENSKINEINAKELNQSHNANNINKINNSMNNINNIDMLNNPFINLLNNDLDYLTSENFNFLEISKFYHLIQKHIISLKNGSFIFTLQTITEYFINKTKRRRKSVRKSMRRRSTTFRQNPIANNIYNNTNNTNVNSQQDIEDFKYLNDNIINNEINNYIVETLSNNLDDKTNKEILNYLNHTYKEIIQEIKRIRLINYFTKTKHNQNNNKANIESTSNNTMVFKNTLKSFFILTIEKHLLSYTHYKNNDKNDNLPFLTTLSLSHHYLEMTYRQIYLKYLFSLKLNNKSKHIFDSLLIILTKETSETQKDILAFYEIKMFEKVSTLLLHTLISSILNSVTDQSSQVLFNSNNNSSFNNNAFGILNSKNNNVIVNNKDYKVCCCCLRFFKFICEEHNTDFQSVLFNDIVISIDKFSQITFFNYLLVLLQKLIIISNLGESTDVNYLSSINFNSNDGESSSNYIIFINNLFSNLFNKQYFFYLMNCFNDLVVEIIQGALKENFKSIVVYLKTNQFLMNNSNNNMLLNKLSTQKSGKMLTFLNSKRQSNMNNININTSNINNYTLNYNKNNVNSNSKGRKENNSNKNYTRTNNNNKNIEYNNLYTNILKSPIGLLNNDGSHFLGLNNIPQKEYNEYNDLLYSKVDKGRAHMIIDEEDEDLNENTKIKIINIGKIGKTYEDDNTSVSKNNLLLKEGKEFERKEINNIRTLTNLSLKSPFNKGIKSNLKQSKNINNNNNNNNDITKNNSETYNNKNVEDKSVSKYSNNYNLSNSNNDNHSEKNKIILKKKYKLIINSNDKSSDRNISYNNKNIKESMNQETPKLRVNRKLTENSNHSISINDSHIASSKKKSYRKPANLKHLEIDKINSLRRNSSKILGLNTNTNQNHHNNNLYNYNLQTRTSRRESNNNKFILKSPSNYNNNNNASNAFNDLKHQTSPTERKSVMILSKKSIRSPHNINIDVENDNLHYIINPIYSLLFEIKSILIDNHNYLLNSSTSNYSNSINNNTNPHFSAVMKSNNNYAKQALDAFQKTIKMLSKKSSSNEVELRFSLSNVVLAFLEEKNCHIEIKNLISKTLEMKTVLNTCLILMKKILSKLIYEKHFTKVSVNNNKSSLYLSLNKESFVSLKFNKEIVEFLTSYYETFYEDSNFQIAVNLFKIFSISKSEVVNEEVNLLTSKLEELNENKISEYNDLYTLNKMLEEIKDDQCNYKNNKRKNRNGSVIMEKSNNVNNNYNKNQNDSLNNEVNHRQEIILKKQNISYKSKSEINDNENNQINKNNNKSNKSSKEEDYLNDLKEEDYFTNNQENNYSNYIAAKRKSNHGDNIKITNNVNNTNINNNQTNNDKNIHKKNSNIGSLFNSSNKESQEEEITNSFSKDEIELLETHYLLLFFSKIIKQVKVVFEDDEAELLFLINPSQLNFSNYDIGKIFSETYETSRLNKLTMLISESEFIKDEINYIQIKSSNNRMLSFFILANYNKATLIVFLLCIINNLVLIIFEGETKSNDTCITLGRIIGIVLIVISFIIMLMLFLFKIPIRYSTSMKKLEYEKASVVSGKLYFLLFDIYVFIYHHYLYII